MRVVYCWKRFEEAEIVGLKEDASLIAGKFISSFSVNEGYLRKVLGEIWVELILEGILGNTFIF